MRGERLTEIMSSSGIEFNWPNEKRFRTIYCSHVESFFLTPARQDFQAANLMWKHGLIRHFFWNAAQSIEKVTKARLLSAYEEAKFSHNFAEICVEAFELAKTSFDFGGREDPAFPDDWSHETVAMFLGSIQVLGNAASRYGEQNIEYGQEDFLRYVALFKYLYIRAIHHLDGTDASTVKQIKVEDVEPQLGRAIPTGARIWGISNDGTNFYADYRDTEARAARRAISELSSVTFDELIPKDKRKPRGR